MPDIKTTLRSMSMTTTIIAVNVTVMLVVFIATLVVRALPDGYPLPTYWLDLPPGMRFISRPWTLLTYMVTQSDVWHCIFNMIWLYWFGTMLESITSGRTVLKVYIAGGIAGALTFILLTMATVAGSTTGLEGASAAVMAIVGAMAAKEPNVKLNLLLLGRVSIKWVALVTLVIFACGLTGSGWLTNASHIAGFVAGAIYGLILRHRQRPVATSQILNEQQARARLDVLLDKVRHTGYASLTSSERKELFELSHRV